MISARLGYIVGVASLAIVGCGGGSSGGGSTETKGTTTGTATVPRGPYAYAVDREPLSRVAHIRAFVAPGAGGQSREITKRPGLVKDPVLTADRKRLAYLVVDPKAKTTDIRIQDVDGSSDRRVLRIHRNTYGLAIAPDGSSLVASMGRECRSGERLSEYWGRPQSLRDFWDGTRFHSG